MAAPTLGPDPLMTITVELRRVPTGASPCGERSEVFFDGTATAAHWAGERPVTGIDHITDSATGTAGIDVYVAIGGPGSAEGDIGDGGEVATYRGHGRGGPSGIVEGVTFETHPSAWGGSTTSSPSAVAAATPAP